MENVTTEKGMSLPARAWASAAACSRPPQQGTSIRAPDDGDIAVHEALVEAGAGERRAVGGDEQAASLVVGSAHGHELDLRRPLGEPARQGIGGRGGCGRIGRNQGTGGAARTAAGGQGAGGAAGASRTRRADDGGVEDVLGRGLGGCAGREVGLHGRLVVRRRLALHERDGLGGAGRQAVAEAIAVVVTQKARLAIDHADGALVARINA